MKKLILFLISKSISFEYTPGVVTIGLEPCLQVYYSKDVYLVYDTSHLDGKRLLRTSKETKMMHLIENYITSNQLKFI